MTGAYAHQWSGPGAWTDPQGRGCGPQERGRHGRGGRGGRHGRSEGPGFPLEALAGWALSRGPRQGPPGPEQLEHLEQMIALRGMRGRGPGPFGRGGRGPRGRGRRRRGDVRLAVLRLLAEEPRNGYGLMQTIEERSGGQWRPSPGSMYPTLSQLEDEQLIRSTEAESGRRFEITDAGRAALEERAGEPDPWISEPDADEHAMSELGPLVIGIGKAVWQVAAVADDAQKAKATELLAETRRALYAILAEAPGGTEGADTDDSDEQSV
jgi:DNA-binding PadR family transcriptional regulator